ncbi:MAG: shikimate kinase [Thermoflavifilum sp.]|nr:shikimate kinase [Thermoflavifilum sp.]
MEIRIFLWGFMGAGKTFLGHSLADAFEVPFYDLDQLIEQQEKLSVSTIFYQYGEDYFRETEARVLRSMKNIPAFVMACGGGAPCYHDNAAWMKQHGITVWLNPPISTLIKRLQPEKKHRPLLAQVPDEKLEATIREMLQQRLAFYSQAHITVSEENVDITSLLLHLQALAQAFTPSRF